MSFYGLFQIIIVYLMKTNLSQLNIYYAVSLCISKDYRKDWHSATEVFKFLIAHPVFYPQ